MGKNKPTTVKSLNRSLNKAAKVKNDEFYTQLSDIENELKHYRAQFRDKVVFLNCDDPFESNFFKYFASNFNHLGLKKLFATSYAGSPIVGTQLPLFEMAGLKPNGRQPFKIEINEVNDADGNGAVDLGDVRYLLENDKNTATPLSGNGDFRSVECIELLKQADVVCTNPPFSLFREYVAQLVEHNMKFLIIGNTNNVTYEEIFPLLKKNEIWLGINNGPKIYQVPMHNDQENTFIGPDGKKYAKMGNTGWFTNLDFDKRHEKLQLYKRYKPEEFQKYDNYDAIEVPKVADIPMDYDGAMGVPVTFLDKYNPDQFEIIGLTDRQNTSGLRTKKYTASDTPKYNDLNRRGAIKVGGDYRPTYARILIKKK